MDTPATTTPLFADIDDVSRRLAETGYLDCDAGATKTFTLDAHRQNPADPFWSLCFGLRPAEELYDLQSDPYETKNLAADPALAPVKAALQQQLDAWMTQQKDQGLETEKLAPSRQGKSDEGGSSPKKKGKKKKNGEAVTGFGYKRDPSLARPIAKPDRST